ncbi:MULTISPECIES: MauE/DoxX family redox-associated membrane protein [Zunongwangia]|uniref:Methylamine utilisation protein MauE domain-containing protein n=2 Tax=Zunongwangia profunda TaxID=398743 RepID=A0A3D5IZ07_9FLAO|nr:MauE/DoxX family redox-associated membrane protein [Zunongwangia profunda]MAG88104.1 hypothetical protein [Flavobacteriaceae bacterium]MAS72453.1 hypothetical protein [Zunongwangia sp.]HCV80270.1 hypothetical protein [Zunongwangia profunda]|tara:strand:- start:112 stop:579 length:468 start_codon:yes stop_codon:yes gene_type:complete
MLEEKTQWSGLAHSKQKNLLYGIICYFILLFAYTGGSKLIDIDPLYTSLRNTPLYFGKSLALIISWGLPAVEIATALSLCFSKFRYTGLICAGILIFVFIMYTGWIVIFPMQQPCSCGGILAEMSWKQHFLFNLFSEALALSGIYLLSPPKKLSR